ncbi:MULTISPECIES: DUF1203 domain-containing protein [unclassified Ruegeria]|uniref:DUF1203 domain-containing protein n=1 Tax=unclassified Ruegeria TaxID=2625375 RepID=UPI0014894004|nr:MULTISPECIES: DUF1203 domain-containing protein [unclassified Ruegeria]NOD76221.1 DUF1203 domain-containing protein [Ruegeria sp. HKCCD4332]NOD90178.1 DUF1203 domain-containing protein [Ruegeria sp. HKCCD4318]NOE15251.1 DUF1203 domain-containing protein [Ruegeria sp. HKCCD4318-2]NOG10539.1 DUF1203 domain-containing protein [Ruegeria sp. HKCCD4315]
MFKITALPTSEVRALQAGASDAYGATPERTVSTGTGNPCRHCLQNIPEGEEMMILAHRPFLETHPYAETGPIFLCAAPCERYEGEEMPEILTTSPDYLIKGYGADDRIVYGTGAITPMEQIGAAVKGIFARPDIAYIHVRSARNNCYQARIDRA